MKANGGWLSLVESKKHYNYNHVFHQLQNHQDGNDDVIGTKIGHYYCLCQVAVARGR
jgi:hypothetical protein